VQLIQLIETVHKVNKKEVNIPDTWKWVTLDDIGVIVSGGTPSTKEPEFWNGDIPWITPADLSNYEDIYISKGKRSISQIGLEYSSTTLLPENSIIFSSRAPIGYVAITRTKLATNQGFKNLILNDDLINPRYVYYYLKTIKELAENMASGTTFLELSASKFKQIPFPLTSIEDQNSVVEKIEELFSQYDKLENTFKVELHRLEILKKKIEKKFFNFENLQTQKLSSILELKSGSFLPSNERNKNGIYNVYGGNGILGKHDNYLYEEPLLVIGRVGEYCGNSYVTTSKSWVTDNALITTFKKPSNLSFYKYYFDFLDLRQLAKSSSQPVISSRSIYNLSAFIPNLEEQERIVNSYELEINNIDKLADSISIERNKLNILVNKSLKEAFQGKLSPRQNSNSSVNSLLKELQHKKDVYLTEQRKINKNYKKTERKKINLFDLIKSIYKSNNFDFQELINNVVISQDELENEFDKLLSNNLLEKIYDAESQSIKYKVK
jgi:type I restriction enzyme S subunit